MQPLISIIVPVYNVEKYLDECLQSIVNQTYKNLEIILIDDGSTDNSPAICDRWAEQDDRIHVIHQTNAGVSVTRNTGLSFVTGEYICFVDSDDYIQSDFCQIMMTQLKKRNADIVACNYNYINNTGEILSQTKQVTENVFSSKESLVELLQGNLFDYFWNKIYKKEIFENILCPIGHVWEDLGTMYKLFLQANKIACLPDALYFYRQHPKSIVGSMGNKALCDIFVMRKMRYEDLKAIYPDIAELDFYNIALSALRLYDRSLWADVDLEILAQAKAFLIENKEKILKSKSKGYRLWFNHRKIYNIIRKGKHQIGNILKRFKK